VAGLERIINSPEVNDVLKTIKGIAEHTQQLIQRVDRRIGPLADEIGAAVTDTRSLIRNTDKRVGDVAATVSDLVSDVDTQVKPLADSLRATAVAATKAFENAQQTLAAAEGVVGKDSPTMNQMNATLKELSGAARSIRVWADYLERHPEALISGKGAAPKGDKK
jgi:paraquat-inducible protein B